MIGSGFGVGNQMAVLSPEVDRERRSYFVQFFLQSARGRFESPAFNGEQVKGFLTSVSPGGGGTLAFGCFSHTFFPLFKFRFKSPPPVWNCECMLCVCELRDMDARD